MHPHPGLLGTPERCSALLAEGPAGIGKSHFFDRQVAAAQALGWRVLLGRPAEAESRLGGCGLVDLLSDVDDDELAALPAPQRRALAVALLRDDAGTHTPDLLTVTVAFTALAKRLAADRPVLLAVDDLHWLDPTTAGALAHLARRLPPAGIGFLLARRAEPADPLPDLAEALDRLGLLTRQRIAPLPGDRIAALLAAAVPVEIPQRIHTRIMEISAGNPFYARELAKYWVNHRDEPAPPIPPSLTAVVGDRLDTLPARAREAVAAASALARPTTDDLAALGRQYGIDDAVAAGVLERSGTALRFTHPLIAAGAYERLPQQERQELHRRFAGVVADVEQRARHLALATDSTDESVATLLDDARLRAERRADPHAALDLARLALGRTPAGSEAAHARRFAVGRLLFKLGDSEAAGRELTALTAEGVPPAIRGRALVLQSEVAFSTVSPEAAEDYALRALDLAEHLDDDDLRIDANLFLANANAGAGRPYAEAALRVAEQWPGTSPRQLASALTMVAYLDFVEGRGMRTEYFEKAVQIEAEAGVPTEESMLGLYASVVARSDDTVRAAEVVQEWRDRATADGSDSAIPFVCMWQAHVAMKTGRLDEAAAFVEEHDAVAARLGQRFNQLYARINAGRLAVLRGDLERARDLGADLLREAQQDGLAPVEPLARRIVGEAALYLGELQEAAAHLTVVEDSRGDRRDDVSGLVHLTLLAEALAGLGRTDDAAAVLARFRAAAMEQDRPSALALLARCEALLSPDLATALPLFDRALAPYRNARWNPFDRARTLLLKGQSLRRHRQKAAAKQTLTEAREAFTAFGAAPWAERAEQEIARIGLRHAVASDELTEAERRVAELAAQGLTTKDIAAALFVSPRTVEANLTQIYRKLGISSRTQLVARLSAAT